MVGDVAVGVGVQQHRDGIVECEVNGDVKRRDDLAPLATEHRVVHKVRIRALVQHVLDDPWILLARGEDQRARELLRRPVLDVGRA